MNPELNIQKKQIKENLKFNDNYSNENNFQVKPDDEVDILKNAILKMNLKDDNKRFPNNFDGNNLFNPNLMKENNSNSDKTTTISASYNPQQPKVSKDNEPFNIIQLSHGYSFQNQKANNDTLSQQKIMPKRIMNMNVNEIINHPPSHLNPQGVNRNNIFIYLRDQTTTITLQREIMGATEQEINYLINEFKGLFRKILKNKNGNYLCSDLFKACSQAQRIIILIELKPTISEDCLDNFATHPIQVLIDRATTENEYNLILESFNDYNKFLFAALDSNGAFTIQKIIDRIPEKFRTNFNIIFTSFVGFISKKKFGIVVVKKFISCTKSDDVTSLLMNLIRKDFNNYAVDQYANYLISFLLDEWKDMPEVNEIKELIRKNFLWMCEKKYSSFICEKYIKVITFEEKRQLINSINLNEIGYKLDNIHFAKIMKFLGIFNNQNNINMQLPSNFNNKFIPNNNSNQPNNSRFNFVNNNTNFNNT